jgi:serine/threonine protein kinase/Tol biopolymer transport system component
MPLLAGSRLDSYEIIAPLGAGGMGEVYRARDATLKRDVAIKVLPEYWSRDPERLRRFEQEAQATAALNHPNIVSIFHVGQYDGSPYIVTELLQGETLRDRLRKGSMRLREVLDHGEELARGLAAAHDGGIVHRDLKPDNIWVTKDGRVKILDFGLAKLDPAKAASTDGETVSVQPQSHPGHVVGTVGYMSPEQVRGQIADARSDIFAVGVILYEMLTGKPAFRKATSADTMSAILNEYPPAVSQIAPSVPPGLQRVVNRCLAKNPEQRFQHASDLGFALESLSDSSGSTVTAVNQTVPGKKWIWIAGAAVVAIAIAAALVLWWRQPPAVPVVEGVTQLTDDGEPKWIYDNLLTDGSRVYFNEGMTSSLKVAQVAVIGGPTAIIPVRLEAPIVVDLSHEGASLLTVVGPYTGLGVFPLRTILLPTGELRRLGDIQALDASFAADGRILFSREKVLYLADKDGSNPRKLLSADGEIWGPNISPDNKLMVFTVGGSARSSIMVSNPDGSGQRAIVDFSERRGVCCARWTPDSRYIVFEDRTHDRVDIWAAQVQAGFLQRAHPPVQLTNGPLSYAGAKPSADGKQIFAIGTKRRGELVRYDVKAKQFVPILAGISAFNPTFASDGKWVAYTSYPDQTLWRSRADGTDRLQLTDPPVKVHFSCVSPDGTQVAYGTSMGEIRVMSMDGGSPRRIAEKNSWHPSWSPDGTRVVFADYGDRLHTKFLIYDLRTGNRSFVPETDEFTGVQWVGEDLLVAASKDRTKLVVFDLKTQKWSDLVPGPIPGGVVNWAHAPDFKYMCYTTGGAEPQVLRVRLADHKVETISSLKGLSRATFGGGQTQISVAPDGSAVFTRDIGTQEIYALTVEWP